jgi:hypothetical protein
MSAARYLTADEVRSLPVIGPGAAKLVPDQADLVRLGERIPVYGPNDLAKHTGDDEQTARTKQFMTLLDRLYGKLERPVPVAFRMPDETTRFLDAGILGFLYHAAQPLVTFETGGGGAILAVSPVRPYRVDELRTAGLKPAMELLVSAARAGRLVTYGELANRLCVALGNARVSHHHMGEVAGTLMNRLLDVDEEAPLLNLIVVRAESEQPGDGATPYLVRRFKLRRAPGTSQRREYVGRGLNQVWGYNDWSGLYKRAFDAPLPRDRSELTAFDEDGQSDNPRFRGRFFRGGLPESAEHKALKEFVRDNPSCLGLGLADPMTSCERALPSGDVMDVEIIDGARRIGVEVKSIRSADPDLNRGVFQCVKYRAVMVAQSRVEPDEAQCEVVLVTQRRLPEELRRLARRLKIRTKTILPQEMRRA